MDRPQQRRERTGILQILLIGAVLAAALYGGVRLLGSTHAAWDKRQAERKAYAAEIRNAANQADKRDLEALRARAREAGERWQAERAEGFRSGSLRCINGQVFRKLSNGWENVPGDRC